MTSLRFVGDLPVWWGLALALVVAVLSWRYYRRESFELTSMQRWLLPSLRAGAFFLGIMTFTGPVLHHRETIGELGKVQIYVDASASMDLNDPHMSIDRKLRIAERLGWLGAGEAERAISRVEESATNQAPISEEATAAALAIFDETPRLRRAELALFESRSELLKQLRERHDVELYLLNGETAQALSLPTEYDSEKNLLEPESFPTLTDLSSGVTATQKKVGPSRSDADATSQGTPRRAVVLITDGQHNTGPSPLQTARILGGQGVPCFAVSTGADQPAPDLAVVSLEYPETVFKNDRIRGVMTIRDQIPAVESFVAQIKMGEHVLWQRQLLTENSGERRIEFDFEAEAMANDTHSQFDEDISYHALPVALEASLSTLSGETQQGNNRQAMRLAIVQQNHKILLLDGRARWETRYLRNVFERDEQWRIDTIIAGPGNDDEILPRGTGDDLFPETREALFEYDLIIIGEIAPELLTDYEYEWLRDFVMLRGGGMIFIDGQRGHMPELANRGLGSLIPVEWSSTPLSSRSIILKPTPLGAETAALRFVPDKEANRRFWAALPSIHNTVSVNALEGAQVLVEADVNGRQQPAVVTQRIGSGRVLYFAFDETWRWRYKAADTWHQRIWNQLAVFTIPPPYTVSDEYVAIDAGPPRYAYGESAELRIKLTGLDGQPAVNTTVDALLWSGDRLVSTIALTADPNVPGVYRGSSEALTEGDYEVSVRASGFSREALRARGEFVVLPPVTEELVKTSINESLLRRMAEDSGGVYLREEELSKLTELLAPFSSGRVVESDTPLWQTYWWLSAIMLLLTIEWISRKRAGLL